MHLARRAETILRRTYRPDGLNFGMNLGETAGAGVADHLHLHALPRWNGDTNFMTVTAQTRVMPELLSSTWEKLHQHFLTEATQETEVTSTSPVSITEVP